MHHLARADISDGAAVQPQSLGVHSRNALLPHRKPNAHANPAQAKHVHHLLLTTSVFLI